MTADDQPLIRSAHADDAPAVTELLAQLGYPDDVANVGPRLEGLIAREDTGVVVAVVGGEVAALAAYQVMSLLERYQPQCRVTALVVHSGARRRGLASALLESVESIAKQRGCMRLEVTTQADRDDAAGFYLAFGFRERPRRLVKPLVSRT